MTDTEKTISSAEAARAAWMRVLALAAPAELEAAMRKLGTVPKPSWLRAPETGMTMVQGRSGGTGARFNLGEMTVTRCALTLPDGEVGVAYVQGRSARHAENAALADALLQSPQWHARVQDEVLTLLLRSRAARMERQAQAVAETRVDFFTMDRGSNPDD
ncbi:MAG: phosphonate C-P lyase system protein PhnG [Janthinobacterium lividum]